MEESASCQDVTKDVAGCCQDSDHQESVGLRGRDPSTPLPVPRSDSSYRLSTDSGTFEPETPSEELLDPCRRISVGAESGYGSPFSAQLAGQPAFFTFGTCPPEDPQAHVGQVLRSPHYMQRERFRTFRVSDPDELTPHEPSASCFRSIATQTNDPSPDINIGLLGDVENSDDDDDISMAGSLADDAFYAEGENEEALGIAISIPLPDVIPEARESQGPSINDASRRNRAHSVSLPIGLNAPSNPTDVGRCLSWIATEFEESRRSSRVNRQNSSRNEGRPERGMHTSASYPGESGFFAFLCSSLSSRRRQRSQSASDAPSHSSWSTSRQSRSTSEAPPTSASASTQTPSQHNHSKRHPDKFL